jgi:uncharacterized protein
MIKEFILPKNKYYFDRDNLELYVKDDSHPSNNNSNVNKMPLVDNKKLFKLVFNVSNMCNLNCKYCYASGGNYKRPNNLMTIEKANEILEQVFEQYTSIKTVYFFGGEPLLNFSLIKYIVEKLEIHYGKMDFRTVTNGLYLTNSKIDFMDTHNFKLYVSLDGPKQFQDYLRGNGTYDIVIKKLEYIKTKNFKSNVELLCTYTKYHQDNVKLNELEHFFQTLGFRYSISDVISNDKNLKTQSKASFVELEKEHIDKSIDRIMNKSKNVGINSLLTAVIDGLVLKKQNQYFCKELADNYSTVFDYNKDEYNCIRLLGTFSKDSEEIKLINSKQNNVCKKCWCKNICSLCVADVLLGNTELPYKNKSCDYKVVYEYAIQKVINILDTSETQFATFINNYYSFYLK